MKRHTKSGNPVELAQSVGGGDVGIDLHGEFKAAVPRDVLHDARHGTRQQEPGDVGVAQVVEPVALGKLKVALLDALPAPVVRLRSAGTHPRGRRQTVRAAQDREQLGRDGDKALTRCGLWRAGDELPADPVTDAADMDLPPAQIDVAPLQARNLAPAQTGQQSQRQADVIEDERESRCVIGLRKRCALLGRVLRPVNRINRRPGQQP